MPITFYYASGTNLYVLFSDNSDTRVDMTEGTGLKAGLYTASDSNISSSGLAAGTYSAKVLVGTGGSATASDLHVGTNAEFIFDGSNEVKPLPTIAPGASGGLPLIDGSGAVPANVQLMNDITVVGIGTSGDLWRG